MLDYQTKLAIPFSEVKYLNKNIQVQQRALNAIGVDDASKEPSSEMIAELKKLMQQTFEAKDTDSVNNEDYKTPLIPSLIEAWAIAAGDPGSRIVQWLRTGAPAGIHTQFELDGLFPTYDQIKEPEFELDEVQTNFEEFVNYEGVEEDDEVFLYRMEKRS